MIITPNIWSALKDLADNGVWHLVGTASASDGMAAGLAERGSHYTNPAAGVTYVNIGSKAAPIWRDGHSIYGPLIESGRIVSADITGTGVGQLCHANGVPIVQTPITYTDYDTPNCLWPICLFLKYRRITASYGAGSDVSLRYAGGSVDLSVPVTAAQLLGAGSNQQYFVPIVNTAIVSLVSTTGLNLRIAGAAYTNPGTAAGYLEWFITYLRTYSAA